MTRPFDDRRILLGVTGGIASYKIGLARSPAHAGGRRGRCRADTRPPPSSSAPSRSRRSPAGPCTPALDRRGHALDHITLARAADAVVVAPATADFMARAATGHADDLLTACLLATDGARAVRAGDERSHVGARPDAGERRAPRGRSATACSSPMPARLPSAREVARVACRNRRRSSRTSGACSSRRARCVGQRVVVTAGPTREAIDPVRFLSNRSSGKMGVAIAGAAWRRGADVTLDRRTTLGCTRRRERTVTTVETTEEMRAAVERAIGDADVLVMAAAPADFRPAAPADRRSKKATAPSAIALEPTPDILAYDDRRAVSEARHRRLRARDRRRPPSSTARSSTRRQLDLIVVNDATEPGAGFSVDTNRVTLHRARRQTHGAAAAADEERGRRRDPRPRRAVDARCRWTLGNTAPLSRAAPRHGRARARARLDDRRGRDAHRGRGQQQRRSRWSRRRAPRRDAEAPRTSLPPDAAPSDAQPSDWREILRGTGSEPGRATNVRVRTLAAPAPPPDQHRPRLVRRKRNPPATGGATAALA